MNIELSRNNHMQVGYNNVPWTTRKSLHDKFFVSFGKVEKTPSSFREACIRSAEEISDKCSSINKTPLVMYSGGIDSEVIAASFIAAGKSFSLAHVRYSPNYNQHETEYVRRFCDRYKLDLKEFDVDPIEYFSRPDTLKNAAADNARLMEVQLITGITDSIKDQYFPISDHPGVVLYRDNPVLSETSKWYWKDYEHLSAYYFHCMRLGIDACPSFYHWSPEIMLAFLLDPIIKNLVNNEPYGKITIRTTAMALYQKTFPEFNFENRPKYRGFEFIPTSLINELNRKINAMTYYDRHSGQSYEYHELIKALT